MNTPGSSVVIDAANDTDAAVAIAGDALARGEIVVLPTDTVYGVGADAFNTQGTRRIFEAKRRGTDVPLPVLVRSPKQLGGLCADVPEAAERLVAAYWPGPLTLVLAEQPAMAWNLGLSEGTVAVRMPFDDVALAIIRAVGPLAVTSANVHGQPPATDTAEARRQLGDEVAVYVDAGPRTGGVPSTIVDVTRGTPRILRSGDLDDADVLAVADGSLDPLEA
ncbi:MAG: L-threonylcarbamoyladenylate synthase, partial [Nitriliruptoraceae bacterium]